MFKHSPNGKGIIFYPNGKVDLMLMENTSWFIASMEKAWFYERLFIKAVIVNDKNVMVKDKTTTA